MDESRVVPCLQLQRDWLSVRQCRSWRSQLHLSLRSSLTLSRPLLSVFFSLSFSLPLSSYGGRRVKDKGDHIDHAAAGRASCPNQSTRAIVHGSLTVFTPVCDCPCNQCQDITKCFCAKVAGWQTKNFCNVLRCPESHLHACVSAVPSRYLCPWSCKFQACSDLL